jgi:hypothetical protein
VKRYPFFALTLLLAVPLFAQGPATTIVPTPTSGAQTLSQLLGPGIQSPNITCVSTSLVCTYTSGVLYAGNGAVLINPGSLTLTANATTCARPGLTSCDLIYYTSGSALATTQSLTTAEANGNSIIALATTNASGVLTLQGTYQDTAGIPINVTLADGFYQIPCTGVASANSAAWATGVPNVAAATGPMLIGTAGQLTSVFQVAVTVTGTNTVEFDCPLLNGAPSRTTAGKGIAITSAAFFYGVQQASLGSQVSVAASGTYNATIVFNDIVMPTAGGAASTVTPVRLDSGTLGINPASGSAQVATTTVGAFYNLTFTPAAAIALNTSLVNPKLSVTLQCAATTATTVNVPYAMIFYNWTPL